MDENYEKVSVILLQIGNICKREQQESEQLTSYYHFLMAFYLFIQEIVTHTNSNLCYQFTFEFKVNESIDLRTIQSMKKFHNLINSIYSHFKNTSKPEKSSIVVKINEYYVNMILFLLLNYENIDSLSLIFDVLMNANITDFQNSFR